MIFDEIVNIVFRIFYNETESKLFLNLKNDDKSLIRKDKKKIQVSKLHGLMLLIHLKSNKFFTLLQLGYFIPFFRYHLIFHKAFCTKHEKGF